MPTKGLFLLCLSVTAWGQTPRLALPEWLAPFPQARDQSASATAMEGTATYTALAGAAEVVQHYEQQLRAAGIDFKAQGDGIGVSIVVSAGKTSAVVRLHDDEGVTKVKVSYAVAPDQPPPSPPILRQASVGRPAVAPPVTAAQAVAQRAVPVASGRREPLSPLAHVPYRWILQSSIVRGTKPTQYAMSAYEAPTDGTVIGPLALPAGAVIVDVLPTDCEFILQDQAGHNFTYKKGEEAKAKGLGPGTWAVYPRKCGGVSIYLH